jgi:2-dehydropantoate 2-reductase
MIMRIGVIGAGSIGLLYAAYLSKTCQVTVFTKTVEQAAEINKNGIILEKKGCILRFNINASQIDQWTGREDLTIVAVKQYQIAEIISQIGGVNNKPINILFLQNGMSHLKQLSSLAGNNLFVGSVEHGAYKENAYTVRHNGEGVTNLALVSGDSASLEALAYSVPADFPVCLQENYYEMLLSKLIVNAIINPLTAILQVQNGLLIKDNDYFCVLKDLFAEIAFILDLANPEVYLQKVIDVCSTTAFNRSSMLKDIESGRKTEVDAILGFLLEEAQSKEKQAPIIRSLYHLVKGKETNDSL